MFTSLPNQHVRRGAFSLVELLVVIGIIALLLSLVLPALAAARQRSFATSCRANLRSVGQCMFAYAANNNGWLLDDTTDEFIVRSWLFSAVGEIGSRDASVLRCSTGTDDEILSYIVNHWIMNGHCRVGKAGSGLLSPVDIVVLGENIIGTNMSRTESAPYWQPPLAADRDERRHGAQLRSNHLFLDGHVDNRELPQRDDHWDRWYVP